MIGKLMDSDNVQLLEAFVLTRHFKATDPRDRIYAILGFATDPD